nr:uncharacterized protein LOC107435069 [Ziziphus jujuba var. spinosa]
MEFYMKDVKALGIIQGAVSDQIFPKIVNAETSKQAWELLYKEFHGGEQVRSVKLQSLRREFKYAKMKEDETLSSYLTRLNDLINQMKTFREVLSNERMVQKVLISLTKAYEPICLVIANTKDLETVEFQKVVAILKSQEQRLNLQVTDFTEKAFSALSVNIDATNSKTQNKGVIHSNAAKFQKTWTSREKKWESKQRFQQRFHGNQAMNTHSMTTVHVGNRWQIGGSQENSKPQCRTCGKYHFGECRFKGKPKCYSCDRFGHWTRKCPNGKNVQKANCTNQMELTGNIFMQQVNLIRQEFIWKSSMPNGTLKSIAGKGTLVIDTDNGKNHSKEVMYLRGLKENLLSVSQMDEHGHYLMFGEGMYHVYDGPMFENLVVKVRVSTLKCTAGVKEERYGSGITKT